MWINVNVPKPNKERLIWLCSMSYRVPIFTTKWTNFKTQINTAIGHKHFCPMNSTLSMNFWFPPVLCKIVFSSHPTPVSITVKWIHIHTWELYLYKKRRTLMSKMLLSLIKKKKVGGSNEPCCVPLCPGFSPCNGKRSFHGLCVPRLQKIHRILQPTFQKGPNSSSCWWRTGFSCQCRAFMVWMEHLR